MTDVRFDELREALSLLSHDAAASTTVCLALRWVASGAGDHGSPTALCPVAESCGRGHCEFASSSLHSRFPGPSAGAPLPETILLLSSLVSTSDPRQRRTGQFFTPIDLARVLLDRAGWRVGGPTLLDPACGAGAFLLAALRPFTESSPDARLSLIGRCVFGVEKDPVMASLTRIVLTAWVLEAVPRGPIPPGLRSTLLRQVRCGDALAPGIWNGRAFDYVVGNPPYLGTRRGRIPRSELQALKARYSTAQGQFDLYAPFVENALSRLENRGCLALVLPRPFLTNDSAAPLRRLLEKGTASCEILDLGRPFDAAVETVGFIARREDANDEAGPSGFPGLWLRPQGSIERDFVERLGLFPTLGSLSRSRRGLEMGKGSSEIRLEPPGFPLLRGCDVQRYRLSATTRFYRPSEVGYRPPEPRGETILIRRVSASLVAAMDSHEHFVLNTLYLVNPTPDVDPWLLLALVNSRPVNTWFRLAFSFEETLFPYIRLSQLRCLPCGPPKHPLSCRLGELARLRTAEASPASVLELEQSIDELAAELFELGPGEKRLARSR